MFIYKIVQINSVSISFGKETLISSNMFLSTHCEIIQ